MKEKTLTEIFEATLTGKVKSYQFINPQAVVVAEWVRFKCQFGCDGYAQSLTCPPYSPEPSRTKKMLEEYGRAAILWKPGNYGNLRKIATDLERTLFLSGYYKALAIPSGPCELCNPCPLEYPCSHPEYARPSMEACGIDVYSTVRQYSFPIEVVRSRSCQPNYYALILIE
ncbi:MAG: hypothetical protein PWP04_22 [Candidatus Atribacteria bacterium]|nr:hypothetical protein [Candidatus Atribacteria bacterium]